MKTLKCVLLMLALCAPAALVAQDNPPPAGGGQMAGPRHLPTVDEQLNNLSRKLSLTDDQKPQVKAILQDQHDQMKQVMDNNSGSREDNRAKMHEIHEQSNAKLRALLTDEQKAKFDKMQAEHRAPMGRGGDQGSAPPPPQQ